MNTKQSIDQNFDQKIDERLLAPLLRQLDRAAGSPPPGDHPDEETLALFAQGALKKSERDALIGHLDGCTACRQVASALLSLADDQELLPSRADPRTEGAGRRFAWTTGRTFWAAVAALLLISATLVLWPEGPRGPQVAAARAWRLDRFGFAVGGVAARSAAPAKQRARLQEQYDALAGPGAQEPEARLERGRLLLALDRPEEARQVFEALLAENTTGFAHSDRACAWLGLGIARYMGQEYSLAEEAFARCLQLDSNSVAGRMNLAMTLEEQGKLAAAVRIWEDLPLETFTPLEQEAIRTNLEELKSHLEPIPEPFQSLRMQCYQEVLG